jgi:hypothetical protein
MFPKSVIKEEPLSLQLAPDNRGTMKLRTSDSLGNLVLSGSAYIAEREGPVSLFLPRHQGALVVALIEATSSIWPHGG